MMKSQMIIAGPNIIGDYDGEKKLNQQRDADTQWVGVGAVFLKKTRRSPTMEFMKNGQFAM